MEEQLGIRLRIAPAFGEVRSMRGIRMRFEEQPGLCRKTRQAIPAAIRRGWRSARKSPTPCSTPMTCCATPEGTERQEEDVAQDLGGLQEVSADNAHGVIRPTGRSGCRRAPVRLNPWRTGHRAGVQLADSACTSPNIACRRSRQASHRVRSSSRRMPARISMPRSGSARRRACSSSLARPAGRWRQRWKRCP